MTMLIFSDDTKKLNPSGGWHWLLALSDSFTLVEGNYDGANF